MTDKFIKLNSIDDETIKKAAELEIELYDWHGQRRANGRSSEMRKFKKYLKNRKIQFDVLVPVEVNCNEDSLANVIEIIRAGDIEFSYKAHAFVPESVVDSYRKALSKFDEELI